MADTDPISSSGAPCDAKSLKAVQDAKDKIKQTKSDITETANKIAQTKQEIAWGKIALNALDTLAAIAMSQAAAIAQSVAATAASALGSLVGKAMEALFKYILFLVTLGPAFLTSVMKKPLDRAIFYSEKELVYINACKQSFSRIMALMEEMFGMDLLPDYNAKMLESMQYLTKCLQALDSLVSELDSSSYFRKPTYDRALSNLKDAIEAIKTTSPISEAFTNRLEARRQDYSAENEAIRDRDVNAAADRRNASIKSASDNFSSDMNSLTNFYAPVILNNYSSLLNKKGYTVDDAGARDYISSLVGMTKDDRSAEATENTTSMIVSATVLNAKSAGKHFFLTSSTESDRVAAQSRSDLNGSLSSGYSTSNNNPSPVDGIGYTADLAGCVNAISNAENRKVAKVTNANQYYEESKKGADLDFEMRQAGSTGAAIGASLMQDLGSSFDDAYSNKWSINIDLLTEEFGNLATNALTAFTYYKKRQACTKGAAFSVAQLRKAFDIIAKFMSKYGSGPLAYGTSTFIKGVRENTLIPAMDIMTKDTTSQGTANAPSKSKMALDANTVYMRMLAGDTGLQSFVTQSLIDTINASRAFEEASALIDELVGKIAAIPDWDGGTERVDTDPLSPAPNSAGWIYTDRKKDSPNSPYVKLTKDVTTLSLTAPFKLISGGQDKEDVRRQLYAINALFNRLVQHNQASVEVLSQLPVESNPYAEQAMAQLDKYGLDMLMDMFEAASFGTMALNIIKGKIDYLSAQVQCAEKIQAANPTPETNTILDNAKAEESSKRDSTSATTAPEDINGQKNSTNQSKFPYEGTPDSLINYGLTGNKQEIDSYT